VLRRKYYNEIMGNEYVKELQKETLKRKNTKFMEEINDIIHDRKNGNNVLKSIQQILEKYDEKKEYLLKRIKILLENRNFKRITISILMVAITLFIGSGICSVIGGSILLKYQISQVAFNMSTTPIFGEVNAFAHTLPPHIKTIVMATGSEVQAVMGGNEIQQVQKFISVVITMIRGLAISISGLIAANAGLKLLTEENTDGPREAKKTFQKILWALFMVFVATGIATYFAMRLA
jgi:hypothetical protein